MDIEFIKSCIKERNIRWTYHVNMRLEERSISRDEIMQAINSYEILEEYPDDKYLPSCIIYAETDDKKFHMVVALDYEDHSIVIITAYKPSLEKWDNDLKTRRKP